MKVSLTTHGGWAGRFAAPQTIDTGDLPPEAAAAGVAAALAAERAPAASEAARAAGKAQAPEAQTYTIIIDHGDRSVTLKASDAGDDPAGRALIDWVRAHVSPISKGVA